MSDKVAGFFMTVSIAFLFLLMIMLIFTCPKCRGKGYFVDYDNPKAGVIKCQCKEISAQHKKNKEVE